jgi:hypothetical protein
VLQLISAFGNIEERQKNEKKKQMTFSPKQAPNLAELPQHPDRYQDFLSEVSTLLAAARKQAARAVNTVLVATYWELGRRIIEFEQGGKERAGYGEQLLQRLSSDLGKRFGRGFSVDNLESMRLFYLTYMESKISQTVSRKLAEPKKSGTPSNMISDYERGKRRFSPEMAERIAEILDIKADRIS